MYHTLMKRQIIKLSNYIISRKMCILLKINSEFEKFIFFLHFLTSRISLNNLF